MKYNLLLAFSLVVMNCWGQSPQLIPYQAIARDNAGTPVLNQNIGLRFSIHDETITGNIVWQESQTVVSNNLGIIVTALGSTTALTTVDWGNGAKFLQVEMDITGGANYLDMGTQQMMSVPYALYAGTSGNQAEPGANGLNALIKQTPESSGVNCQYGGTKIETGMDLDSNGELSLDEIDNAQTQYVCNGAGIQSSLNIGDVTNGGIVFYIDETGQHGLVALDYDIVDLNAPFFSTTAIYVYTTSTNVGSGEINTMILANSDPDPNSAVTIISNLSANGYDDWFIPSRDELALLRNNLFLQGIGNLLASDGPPYRTSSYYLLLTGCTTYSKWFNYSGGMSSASFMHMGDDDTCGGINLFYRVRPIRSF
jgi:hypothetical protein